MRLIVQVEQGAGEDRNSPEALAALEKALHQTAASLLGASLDPPAEGKLPTQAARNLQARIEAYYQEQLLPHMIEQILEVLPQ